MSTSAVAAAVRSVVSAARMGTYEQAMRTSASPDVSALELYTWNAQVSAAFMAPLHICEVAVRNAANEALEAVCGPRWPWDATYENSLPTGTIYDPRRDLRNIRNRQPTTGKVIPELKFAFWQKMYTRRHDVRLWNAHLARLFPNLNHGQPMSMLREQIYNDLEQIRELRNRIAHHEPIFRRNLTDDLAKVFGLVHARCAVTSTWLRAHQQASALIALKPVPLPPVSAPPPPSPDLSCGR